MSENNKIYQQLLNTLLVLRDTSEDLRCRSANDLTKVINSSIKSKREPSDIRKLYELEKMITDLRHLLMNARIQLNTPAIPTMLEG